jgi:hypothetical protein
LFGKPILKTFSFKKIREASGINLKKGSSVPEQLLFTMIQKIFPNQEKIANDRNTIYELIGRRLELDIYINELKLAFEYQV